MMEALQEACAATETLGGTVSNIPSETPQELTSEEWASRLSALADAIRAIADAVLGKIPGQPAGG